MKTGKNNWRSGAIHFAAAPLLMFAAGAHAAVSYEASVGFGQSDNITRVATDEQEETVGQAGLRFSVDHEGPRLNADFIGDLSYQHYLDDTFDSELLGNLGGTLRYGFIPDRFEWVLDENFGQVLLNPLEPATPENRENINHLSTGPDFTFPVGTQTRIRLSGRYGITTYEDSPFDSDSVLGELALVRALSSSSSISAHVRNQRVTYDESLLDADYTQDEYFARYEARGRRTHLTLDAGFSRLDREAAEEEEDSPLVRASVRRQLSSSMSATLSASREFANSGSSLGAEHQGGVGLGTVPGRQTILPFTSDRIVLNWDYNKNRTQLGAMISRDDREYEDADFFNQTLTTVSLRARRELTPRMGLGLGGSHSKAEFALPGQEYTDLGADISLDRRMTRTSTLSLRYEYFDRDSDLPGTSYTEGRIWLSFVYGNGRPRERFIEALPPEVSNP